MVERCTICGRSLVMTPTPKTPHLGRLDCPEHGFRGWAAKPMTRERAEGMTMPFGKYESVPLGDVAANDPDYLRWLLSNVPAVKGSLRKAIDLLLEDRP